MYYIVLVPPNNAYTALLRAKRNIFSLTKMISSWSLPPIVPLFCSEELPVKKTEAELPSVPVDGILFNKVNIVNKQFVIESKNIKSFSEEVESVFDTRLIPLDFYGIHLLDPAEESGAEIKTIIESCLKDLPKSVLNWKTMSLEIISSELKFFANEGWWNKVYYKTVKELSFKKAVK
ncbi:MAG: hypothetical protein PQJ46_16675 [Spirochaetales bacterium]|nr:hypothetical protein [Spirochaetales bacterium]